MPSESHIARTTQEVEVSVVIPCFDAEATIGTLLRTLVEQDSNRAFEVIVVDNCSRDGTRAIVDAFDPAGRFQLIILGETEVGSYATRNRGLKAARGSVVLFTDADCRPARSWLEALASGLEDTSATLAGGEITADAEQTNLCARHAAETGVLAQNLTLKHPHRPFLQTANLAVRRDAARAVGGFDPSLLSGGDADFCWRVLDRFGGQPVLISNAAVRHHHRTSVSALYRQFRRYGQADVLLARKHGARFGVGLGRFGMDVLRLVLWPVRTLIGAIQALRKRDLLPLVSPSFRVIRAVARRHGQVLTVIFGRAVHRT